MESQLRVPPKDHFGDLTVLSCERSGGPEPLKNMELFFRFLVGGLVVSCFAALGDVLKPKSFAGLFGAAPSVAIASLSLTVLSDGKAYAALEARSMVAGAGAFLIYACACAHVLARRGAGALSVTSAGLVVWLACAFGAWLVVLR